MGFTATHPHFTVSPRRAWYLVWASLPLLVVVGALVGWRSTIVAPDGGPQPFFQDFVTFLRDASLLLALGVFGRRWLRQEPGALRRQYLYILLPFTLFALNDSMDSLLYVLGLRSTGRPLFGAFAVVEFLAVFLIAGLGLRQSKSAATRGEHGGRMFAGWVLFSFFASFLQFLGHADAANMLFVHFIVDGVGIVAQFYGVARYHILEIDLRFRLGIRSGLLGGIGLAIVIVVQQVIEQSFGNSGAGVAGGVVAGLGVLALHPIQRLAERVANTAVPQRAGTEEYLTFRKFEIYRAALEGAWADGRVTKKEHDILDRLRGELGITDTDARRVERDVEARAKPTRGGAAHRDPDSNRAAY